MPKFLCNGETSNYSDDSCRKQSGRELKKISVPYDKPKSYPHNDGHYRLSEGDSDGNLQSPSSIIKPQTSRSSSTVKIWINNDVSVAEKGVVSPR